MGVKVEEKMRVSREVSDFRDEVEKWRSAAAEAEEKEAQRAAGHEAHSLDQRAQLRAHECLQRYQEVTELAEASQHKVDALHGHLLEKSASLASHREALETRKRYVEELMV